MFKRILIYSLIAAAIAAVVFFYFKLTKAEGSYSNALSAVPANASLVLEINTMKQEADEMNLLLELSMNENVLGDVSFNPLTEWPAVIQELMKLKTYQPQWQGALSNGAIIFSANDQLRADTWLMTVGMKAEHAQSVADDMMYAWLTKEKFTARDFKGRNIMQGVEWNYCLMNNCLVVSPSMAMMEDAVIQQQKNDVMLRNENFMAAHDVMSADASFHLFTPLSGDEWIQLDPVARDGQWHLSGYALTNDSTQHSMQLCGDGQPFNIASELPSNTVMLDVFSYTDFETGWLKQEDFYANTTASKFWSQAWKDLGDTCQCDLNEAMLSWRTGEFGSAVIATTDSTTAEVLFFGIKDSLDVNKYVATYLDRTSPIHQLMYPQLFDRNKPQTFLVEPMYITQQNNYAFVAASPSDLLALNSSNLLKDDERFARATQSSNRNTGRFAYQREYYSSPLPQSLLSFMKGLDYITITSEPFREGKILMDIALPYKAETSIPSEVRVETNAHSTDSTQATTPEIGTSKSWTVVNHNTKENETLYQNEKGELCLNGADGKLLWAKAIAGKIVGEVTQVDALKNNKLQYAFATDNSSIYIVDRNGNALSGFPIHAKTPMCSGLFVFDYDSSKNYRLIIAEQAGRLWNINVKGVETEGWKYTGESPIALVKHLKHGGHDVLVTVSHAGTVEVLKRNGEKYEGKSIALENWNKEDVKVNSATGAIQISFLDKEGKQDIEEIAWK